MKIKRIQVKNIGPYVNENAFDFDVSDITKRMVLIGGKNGAGKTTLFNAIKICLYGCVAYGFESNNAKYFAEIEKIINANEKLQKIGEAEVVIDLLMDDGKYVCQIMEGSRQENSRNLYCVQRRRDTF